MWDAPGSGIWSHCGIVVRVEGAVVSVAECNPDASCRVFKYRTGGGGRKYRVARHSSQAVAAEAARLAKASVSRGLIRYDYKRVLSALLKLPIARTGRGRQVCSQFSVNTYNDALRNSGRAGTGLEDHRTTPGEIFDYALNGADWTVLELEGIEYHEGEAQGTAMTTKVGVGAVVVVVVAVLLLTVFCLRKT